jgi:hypothetical protein
VQAFEISGLKMTSFVLYAGYQAIDVYSKGFLDVCMLEVRNGMIHDAFFYLE